MKVLTSITILTVLLYLTSTAEAKPMNACGGHVADIVFVLDVSSSIWPMDFQVHVLTFVREMVSNLDIGSGAEHTRVGAITFSDEVWMEFHLNHFMDKEKLLQRIEKIKQRGGNTDTHEALQFVDENLFEIRNGARPNVSRIVVVITDGAPRKAKETLKAARNLRDHGAAIFAIGVGPQINEAQLKDMASQPSSDFVFEVTNFQALANIQKELVVKTCKVQTTITLPITSTAITTTTATTAQTTTTLTTTTTTPSTTTTAAPSSTATSTTTSTTVSTTSATPETTEDPLDFNVNDRPTGDVDTVACINRPAEVYFVLDSSSSIWIHDFEEKMLGFVRAVVDIFDIGSDRTRVGVITFSDVPHTVFGLSAHEHKDELLKAVHKGNIRYNPGLTYTAEALQQARMNLHNEGRKEVNKIIILITDGQSKDPDATVAAAKAAGSEGITVFAVGIGEGVDSNELHAVATQPSEDFVLMVDDFNALLSKKMLLAARTCGANATLIPPVKPAADSNQRCDAHNSDILFIYDSSMLGGISSTQIISTLDRVSATLEALSADVTVGTLTASTCVEQGATPMASTLEFSKHVRSVVRSQQSQIFSILKTARLTGFSVKYGHRESAKKVLVIVLDPSSTGSLTQVAQEAAKMRDEGVEVFVVTSGRQGGQLLHEIVSHPTDRHIIHLPALDFSDYVSASHAIVNSLCGL